MKNLPSTKYLSNLNHYLFTTSLQNCLYNSKYKKMIGSINLQFWLKNYLNKKIYPLLKAEELFSYLRSGYSSIPHPDKIEKGGEDAFFESENLLVVADGVGGWNQYGIDPSAYSKKLCELIHNCCKKYEDKISYYCDIYNYSKPKFTENIVKNWIIQAVHENKEKGSSTVCVLYLDKLNKTLYSGYMGDSCYLIARPISIGNFQLIFKSEEQCHGFNVPYQIGTDGDNPCFAKTDRHNIERNDIIIVASDGLWDNVEVDKIIECLNDLSRNSNSIQIETTTLAKKLSFIAEDLSKDKNHYSPFCKKAMEYNKSGIKYFGGKPDDITIVTAQVLLSQENEDEKEMGLSKSLDTTVDGDLEIPNPSSVQL